MLAFAFITLMLIAHACSFWAGMLFNKSGASVLPSLLLMAGMFFGGLSGVFAAELREQVLHSKQKEAD